MASTYTPAGIELIATGEQSGTWGATTNTNWEMMEEMVTGIQDITLSATTYTLTASDGVSSEGRHAVIVFSGSPGGECTVTVSPNDMQKVYFIKNDADENVVISQGTGDNVTVTSGDSAIVYCDGTGAGASVQTITAGGGAGGAGGAIHVNSTSISVDYTLETGDNGLSVGPITVENGVSVTISNGQRWVVI